MRRAILTFKLPEDEDAYKQCNSGLEFGLILFEIREDMVRKLKDDLDPETECVVRAVLEKVSMADLNCIP